MIPDELVKHYPRLYHMAEADTWEKIKQHGLLSTSALLDLFGIEGSERFAIESCHRPEMTGIEHPRLQRAKIRDQKPMTDAGLRRALAGSRMTPRQWYELLNSKVFFWLTRDRLFKLLNARPYRNGMHTVLTVDTAGLVGAHQQQIHLCPMNSGCTKPFPHPRGPQTFQPISLYPFEARKPRGPNYAVVELTVERAVPDIEKFVVCVEHMRGDNVLEVLYS